MDPDRSVTIEVLEESSIEVSRDALLAVLRDAGPQVEAIAFVAPGSSVTNSGDRTKVATLLDLLGDEVHVVIGFVPATSAVKRVEGDTVVESLDRDRLSVLAPPVVVDRAWLDRAMQGADLEPRVRPVELIVAAGARIEICRS